MRSFVLVLYFACLATSAFGDEGKNFTDSIQAVLLNVAVPVIIKPVAGGQSAAITGSKDEAAKVSLEQTAGTVTIGFADGNTSATGVVVEISADPKMLIAVSAAAIGTRLEAALR